MLKTMLEAMEAQSRSTLEEKGGASALWFSEWAKLALSAYEPGKKVVYTSAYAFPMEILAAFDVVPFDFELASGLLGAAEMAVPAMSEAEGRGYSMDMCSLHRTALGASYLEFFPKPDILVTTSYFCDGKVKTNEILSIVHAKDAALLEVPATIDKASVSHVERQLRDILAKIGEAVGQEPDLDRLREAVQSSNRARRSQQKMLELLAHRPAPWGGRELVAYSINSLWLAASDVKEKLDEAFVREMEQKIAAGDLPPETHRLYWFAWLPTYQSDVFDILREHQVSIPLCETFELYWDEIDEQNPFEGLALKCLKNPFVGGGERRTERLAETKDAYHLDGAILFATPACRHANAGYRLLRDALAKLDLPFLMLDMDIEDPRNHSRGQIRTRLEAFIELLDQKKL